MSAVLLSIASHFIGPLSGILATRVMDVIDDGLKLTASWPDTVKRAVVLALSSVLPLVATSFPQLAIPSNPADLLTQPFIQSVLAFVIALVLKGHATTKAIATKGVPVNVPAPLGGGARIG